MPSLVSLSTPPLNAQALTLKGVMNTFGSYCWDDVDLTTKGGEPMSQNQMKGLFTVETHSGYNVRYRAAGFHAKICKFMASNFELEHEHAINSLGHRLPFLRELMTGNATELNKLAEDQRAILRRITVFHLQTSMAPAANDEAPSLDDIMAARLRNL